MKITEQLIHDPPRELSIDQRQALNQEGQSAYLAGLPSNGPPHVDTDMTAFWKIGWYQAHQEHYELDFDHARARCDACCGHRGKPLARSTARR